MLTNFLDSVAAAELADRKTQCFFLSGALVKTPVGFSPLGFVRSRVPFGHGRAPLNGCDRTGVTSQPHVVIAANHSGRHAWR